MLSTIIHTVYTLYKRINIHVSLLYCKQLQNTVIIFINGTKGLLTCICSIQVLCNMLSSYRVNRVSSV